LSTPHPVDCHYYQAVYITEMSQRALKSSQWLLCEGKAIRDGQGDSGSSRFQIDVRVIVMNSHGPLDASNSSGLNRQRLAAAQTDTLVTWKLTISR
jgi:hypothetical protein